MVPAFIEACVVAVCECHEDHAVHAPVHGQLGPIAVRDLAPARIDQAFIFHALLQVYHGLTVKEVYHQEFEAFLLVQDDH